MASAPTIERLKQARNVEGLLEVLRLGDARARRGAARALGQLADARAVEPLIRSLEDENASTVEAAITSLGSIGDPRALPHLMERLPSQSAATAIIGLGAAAVEPLVGVLRAETKANVQEYPGSDRSRAAASVLARIGDPRAVEPLIESLRTGPLALREEAARALGRLGDPRAIEPLIEALRSDAAKKAPLGHVWARSFNPSAYDSYDIAGSVYLSREELESLRDNALHAAAIEGLRCLGQLATPALVAALRHEDASVRDGSAICLAYLGDANSVEPLIELLNDTSSQVRENAAVALGTLGDPRGADPLIEGLLDESSSVQYRVAEALRAIAGAESRLLWTDRRGQTHEVHPRNRRTPRLTAARRLLEVEESALTRISAALDDTSGDSEWRVRACIAVRHLLLDRPETELMEKELARAHHIRDRAVALLSAALRDRGEAVREAATEALRGIVPWTPLAATLVTKLGTTELVGKLSSTDPDVRKEAEGRLHSLADPAAIEALVPLLDHPDGDVVAAAARTLTRLGDARGSAWILIDAARRDERSLYDLAARNLERAGAAAVPLLQAAATDESAAVRWSVAHVLGRCGAVEAVPLLIELLQDADDGVREAALAGLERIGGQAAEAAIAAHAPS